MTANEFSKLEQPLLSVGAFGTHLYKNPAGSYSFVGTIHKDLKGSYPTYDEGLGAFVSWFKGMSAEDQRAHVGNLRNDVFKLVMEA